MTAIINKNKLVLVSTLTTREIFIWDNNINYHVDIEIDVPYEEIWLNAWEQLI